MELAYSELRRLARHYLRGQGTAKTLEPAVLVHEAYLRLARWEGVHWMGQSHFAGVASIVMRQIVCAYARRRATRKRGGDRQSVTLHSGIAAISGGIVDAILLDDVLQRLADIDPDAARIVEMRVFGGLTMEEIAPLLEVSDSTVKRSWTFAKTWLKMQMQNQPVPQ